MKKIHLLLILMLSTFALKAEITATFTPDPEVELTEIPAQFNFTLSEDAPNLKTPKLVVKCGEQEKSLQVMKQGGQYKEWFVFASYYIKGELLDAIKAAGGFSLVVTLDDGTVIEQPYRMKKPITATFTPDPEVELTEIPAQFNFTLSEDAPNLKTPKLVVKCGEQEKSLQVMKQGGQYKEWYVFASYYIKGELLDAIKAAGEFSLVVTLDDGTVIEQVYKIQMTPKLEPEWTAASGSVYAGMPDEVTFSIDKGVEVAIKAVVNETSILEASAIEGSDNTEFRIPLSTLSDEAKANIAETGVLVIALEAEGYIAPEVQKYYVCAADLTWTPEDGREDGHVFTNLPQTLTYTLSSQLPADATVSTGIVASATLPDDMQDWSIKVPAALDGVKMTFDLSALTGGDVQAITEAGSFTIGCGLANKTLSASYAINSANTPISLGYCNEEITGVTNQLGSEGAAGVVAGAIRIPESKMQSLKGGKITRIRIAIGEGLQRVYGWIRPSLSEPAHVFKQLDDVSAGWHEIVFDTPYVIDGGEIFIGYQGYQERGVKAILAGGVDRPDGCWLGIKDNWEDHSSDGYGTLYIRAYGEASLPEADLGVDNVCVDKAYYTPDESVKASLTLLNSGVNKINNYSVTYSIDGGESVVRNYTEPLDKDGRRDVTLDIPMSGLADGNHTVAFTCRIDDNGLVDGIEDNNQASVNVALYSSQYERNVLLEQFTTINCVNCPKGDAALENAVQDQDNIIWIAHHVGFGVDELTVQGSSEMLDYGVAGAPSLMVDRTVHEGNAAPFAIGYGNASTGGDIIRGYINASKGVPAFAKADVAYTYDSEKRTLDINVSAERNAICSTFYPETNLTVYLVEDNVTAKTPQVGSGSTEHSHVIRAILTPATGVPVEWDGDAYRTSYNTQLDAAWKAGDMSIVAVINRPFNAEAPDSVEVLNAASVAVDAPEDSGVADVYGNGSGLYVKEGSVAGVGFASIDVFNTSGQRVANINLAPGIYLVSAVTDAGQHVTQKVVVK